MKIFSLISRKLINFIFGTRSNLFYNYFIIISRNKKHVLKPCVNFLIFSKINKINDCTRFRICVQNVVKILSEYGQILVRTYQLPRSEIENQTKQWLQTTKIPTLCSGRSVRSCLRASRYAKKRLRWKLEGPLWRDATPERRYVLSIFDQGVFQR